MAAHDVAQSVLWRVGDTLRFEGTDPEVAVTISPVDQGVTGVKAKAKAIAAIEVGRSGLIKPQFGNSGALRRYRLSGRRPSTKAMPR